jgi:Collagen triple helix repeat (20 copies)
MIFLQGGTMFNTAVAYLRRNHLAAVALFFALGGGTAYAAASAVDPGGTVYVCVAKSKVLSLGSAKSNCARHGKKLTLAAAGSTGPTGVTGPKGEAGSKGEAGPKGEPGVKGEPGAANVITSEWFEAPEAKPVEEDGTKLLGTSVKVPALTKNVIETADVNVFSTFPGGNVWQLPYTSYAGGKGNTLYFVLVPGEILIRRFTFDDSASIGLASDLKYRYVIIPRGTTGAA